MGRRFTERDFSSENCTADIRCERTRSRRGVYHITESMVGVAEKTEMTQLNTGGDLFPRVVWRDIRRRERAVSPQTTQNQLETCQTLDEQPRSPILPKKRTRPVDRLV